jgi:hypothetical protein
MSLLLRPPPPELPSEVLLRLKLLLKPLRLNGGDNLFSFRFGVEEGEAAT